MVMRKSMGKPNANDQLVDELSDLLFDPKIIDVLGETGKALISKKEGLETAFLDSWTGDNKPRIDDRFQAMNTPPSTKSDAKQDFLDQIKELYKVAYLSLELDDVRDFPEVFVECLKRLMRYHHPTIVDATKIALAADQPQNYATALLDIAKKTGINAVRDLMLRVREYSTAEVSAANVRLEEVPQREDMDRIVVGAEQLFRKTKGKTLKLSEAAQSFRTTPETLAEYKTGKTLKKQDANAYLHSIGLLVVAELGSVKVYPMVKRFTGEPEIYVVKELPANPLYAPQPYLVRQSPTKGYHHSCVLIQEGQEGALDAILVATTYNELVGYIHGINWPARRLLTRPGLRCDLQEIERSLADTVPLTLYIIMPPEGFEDGELGRVRSVAVDNAFREYTGLKLSELVQPFRKPVKY